jgi:very-short-patch-repair endonuclease
MDPNKIIRGQPVRSELYQRAQELRHDMTAAEEILWRSLRAGRLEGYHFRRQQIIQNFIVDFYCHAARLVIEIDGPVHAGQTEYDHARQENLEELGLTVIRFTNDEIENELDAVLPKILEILKRIHPFPSGKGPGDR